MVQSSLRLRTTLCCPSRRQCTSLVSSAFAHGVHVFISVTWHPQVRQKKAIVKSFFLWIECPAGQAVLLQERR